jgi:ABC-type molybdate transport system substrate-binding protein
VNVVATYPIAVVTGSSQTDAATSFLNYVVGRPDKRRSRSSGSGPAS